MVLLSASLLLAQTMDMGDYVYFNNDGDLNVLVEAGVAVRSLDSPYVLFVLSMGMDANKHANIDRDSITLIHEGKEYKMPDLKTFRSEYKNENRDWRVYQKLGYEQTVFSGMNTYQYNSTFDFFPLRNQYGISTDSGSISGTIGLRTKVYFKNPGFEVEDKFIIQVKDRDNPEIVTNVVVIF
jgi:hypothetical protein